MGNQQSQGVPPATPTPPAAPLRPTGTESGLSPTTQRRSLRIRELQNRISDEDVELSTGSTTSAGSVGSSESRVRRRRVDDDGDDLDEESRLRRRRRRRTSLRIGNFEDPLEREGTLGSRLNERNARNAARHLSPSPEASGAIESTESMESMESRDVGDAGDVGDTGDASDTMESFRSNLQSRLRRFASNVTLRNNQSGDESPASHLVVVRAVITVQMAPSDQSENSNFGSSEFMGNLDTIDSFNNINIENSALDNVDRQTADYLDAMSQGASQDDIDQMHHAHQTHHNHLNPQSHTHLNTEDSGVDILDSQIRRLLFTILVFVPSAQIAPAAEPDSFPAPSNAPQTTTSDITASLLTSNSPSPIPVHGDQPTPALGALPQNIPLNIPHNIQVPLSQNILQRDSFSSALSHVIYQILHSFMRGGIPPAPQDEDTGAETQQRVMVIMNRNLEQDGAHAVRRIVLFDHNGSPRDLGDFDQDDSVLGGRLGISDYESLLRIAELVVDGPRRRTASPEMINKLPIITKSSSKISSFFNLTGLIKNPLDSMLANTQHECAICKCSYDHGDKLRILDKCNHAFHQVCVDTWLTHYVNSCPLCRVVACE